MRILDAHEGEEATDTRGDTAERALEHLRRLQKVTDVALSHLAVEDLLRELLVRVSEVLETDTAAILLLEETTNELVARAAKGIEEEVEQGVRIPIGKGFAGRIAAQCTPVILDEVDHSNVMNPILREKGIRSLLGVPLLVQGELLGVLHVGTLTPRRFTESDVELLQLVADRVALAVNVSLYERERVVTETLQRTFLPERLPVIPGVHIVARYIPASRTGVGGDWYDAFVLPNGLAVVAVGDVVGRGLRAASVMGRLRNGLRAYAVEQASPEDVVTSLNSMLRLFDRDEMATLIYSLIDIDARTITFVNAGHLPPLIATPGSPARFLDTHPLPPLGVRMDLRPKAHTFDLPVGSTLLFYTDGLVERRDADLSDRLEQLRALMDEAHRLEELPDALLQRLASVEPMDDVALLAVRSERAVAGPYRIHVPARPSELARIRTMVRRWLKDQSVPDRVAYDILVAAGEACANAVEHAYGAETGDVEITLTRSESMISVAVTDRGRWRGPRGKDRGRGLPMMQRLTSSFDVSATEEGTRVLLSWRLPEGVAS